MTVRILIAEDEEVFIHFLLNHLKEQGFHALVVRNAKALREALGSFKPDMLLLDVTLPDSDGLKELRDLRSSSNLPVMLLTSRTDEHDRLMGLEAGADDYIVKPFSPPEVIARIRAILRRTRPDQEVEVFASAGSRQRKDVVEEFRIELTPTELKLLEILSGQPGQVYSRSQLMDLIYPDNLDVSLRALDSHIKNLRRKLEKKYPDRNLIRSVYGVGFVYGDEGSPDDVAMRYVSQQFCVLFADISRSLVLYESLGNDTAFSLIEAALSVVKEAVERNKGRVVKLIGDEVMALFTDAQDAGKAACEMQQRATLLPAAGGKRANLHVGFHAGEVISCGNDVYGDTVAVAAKITRSAKPGQILCSAQSLASSKDTSFMDTTDYAGIASPQSFKDLEIVELIWHRDFSITENRGFGAASNQRTYTAVLTYNGKPFVADQRNPTLMLGRDPSANVLLSHPKVSRVHAWIEMRADGFYLVDKSTNGTYVSFDDKPEFLVKHRELHLRTDGKLSMGGPLSRPDGCIISFRIESGLSGD